MTLSERLLDGDILHLRAGVAHARRGAIRHKFAHEADFLLFAPENMRPPSLMSKNRFNVVSYHDCDHGGQRGKGRGAVWAWSQLRHEGLARRPGMVLALLTQPRFLWARFNPVSFWMVIEGNRLIAVIAEVNNTFGQRHCYLCRNEGFAPIEGHMVLRSAKVFHVSPFQDVSGDYDFNYSLTPDRIAIRITLKDAGAGLDAGMSGQFDRLTVTGVISACLRRTGGPLRTLALIYWHAVRLRLKGAAYRRLPPPPEQELTR